MIQLSSLLVTGADGRWHPGVGDASVLGWVTVVAYVVAALLSYRALRLHRANAQLDQGGPARASSFATDEASLVRFWRLVVVVLVLLGINKQLDLQSWLAQTARSYAISQGWYGVRRPVQLLFIAVIGIGGMLTTGLLAYSMRHVLHRVIGALLGLGALVTFVIVRAASFHHVDALLTRGPIHLNWVLELGGIGLIALSAFRQSAR